MVIRVVKQTLELHRLVAGVRKHEYKKPVTTMRDYLERMEAAIYMGRVPKEPAPIVIASASSGASAQ